MSATIGSRFGSCAALHNGTSNLRDRNRTGTKPGVRAEYWHGRRRRLSWGTRPSPGSRWCAVERVWSRWHDSGRDVHGRNGYGRRAEQQVQGLDRAVLPSLTLKLGPCHRSRRPRSTVSASFWSHHGAPAGRRHRLEALCAESTTHSTIMVPAVKSVVLHAW
jgi:hypothetical protein